MPDSWAGGMEGAEDCAIFTIKDLEKVAKNREYPGKAAQAGVSPSATSNPQRIQSLPVMSAD